MTNLVQRSNALDPDRPQFVLRADEPFRGSAQSLMLSDGTVAYSNGLSPEQYAQDRGFPIRIVGEAEFGRMLKAYHDTLVTAPAPESLDEFDHALGVLPPCRWKNVGEAELFHISERVTGDLVIWHAHRGSHCVTFTDYASRTDMQIMEKASTAFDIMAQRVFDAGDPALAELGPDLAKSLKDVATILDSQKEDAPVADVLALESRALLDEVRTAGDPSLVFERAGNLADKLDMAIAAVRADTLNDWKRNMFGKAQNMAAEAAPLRAAASIDAPGP